MHLKCCTTLLALPALLSLLAALPAQAQTFSYSASASTPGGLTYDGPNPGGPGITQSSHWLYEPTGQTYIADAAATAYVGQLYASSSTYNVATQAVASDFFQADSTVTFTDRFLVTSGALGAGTFVSLSMLMTGEASVGRKNPGLEYASVNASLFATNRGPNGSFGNGVGGPNFSWATGDAYPGIQGVVTFQAQVGDIIDLTGIITTHAQVPGQTANPNRDFGAWASAGFNYYAYGNTPNVVLSSANLGSGHNYALPSSVPEPGAIALGLGAGTVGLIWLRRRRR